MYAREDVSKAAYVQYWHCFKSLRKPRCVTRCVTSTFSHHKAQSASPTSLASYCGTFTIWAGQCAITRSSREHRHERYVVSQYTHSVALVHISGNILSWTVQSWLNLRSLERAHRRYSPTSRQHQHISISTHSRPTCHTVRPPKMRHALWRRGAPPRPSLNYTRSRSRRCSSASPRPSSTTHFQPRRRVTWAIDRQEMT